MARLYNEVLRLVPDRYGNGLRAGWLGRRCAAFGPGCVVARGGRVLAPERLVMGSGVVVARDVTLDARGGLELRDEALVGFETVLLTHTHRSDRVGVAIQHQGMFDGPVTIGERAWLGMRVVVLPGITIGADAIVAAGSVVTRDVPARAVVAGVPARVLRSRDGQPA